MKLRVPETSRYGRECTNIGLGERDCDIEFQGNGIHDMILTHIIHHGFATGYNRCIGVQKELLVTDEECSVV